MWILQINWNGTWITVQTGFPTRGEAEWAAGRWKLANNCRGDPFRAVQSEDATLPL
jgi:hypothetical protein